MVIESYRVGVARASDPADRRIDRAVLDALAGLLPTQLGEQPHLTRAVLADRIAAAATRLSRVEVMAARDRDDATWDDVAAAFAITRQAAHERFRTGPDGLHSRYFKRYVP
jgi:hypothetical protein